MNRAPVSYELIRSRKRWRSMALRIHHSGQVQVLAPWHVSRVHVQHFVNSKSDWILQQLSALPRERIPVSEEHIRQCRQKAPAVFEKRVGQYADRMKLFPTRVSVSSARTRWGSCTARNQVRLNWRLLLLPVEVLDAVIIHELAHIREKNHSPRFWKLVAEFDPKFLEHRRELKRHSYLLSL